jgi:hypothetical protein
MNLGYSGLFWVDGSSCIISILILHCLKERKTSRFEYGEPRNHPFSRIKYFDFSFVCFVTAMLFFQPFTTLPLTTMKNLA